MCFELHFRVTPGQFRSAAASSLHRRLALLATSTRPSFSKNAYLGILFAPMYQKYSLDFVSFVFLFQYSNCISTLTSLTLDNVVARLWLDRSRSRIAALNRSCRAWPGGSDRDCVTV